MTTEDWLVMAVATAVVVAVLVFDALVRRWTDDHRADRAAADRRLLDELERQP